MGLLPGKGSPELKKIKDGYSGAPVFDPNGRRVVAVITHRQGTDKGFAIDIANLPRVYPRAADFIADVQADSDGEYATEIDHPLVKMLDHTKQLAAIRELLKDGGSDRAIVLVEACPEDWPSYLADHVHLDPWPDGDGNPPEAITLGLKRFDEQSFWEALLEAVPNASRVSDKAAKQIVVRWINGASLRVLYLPVGLERHGRHLPEIIRGAQTTLDDLSDFVPDTRVLVIIACLRNKVDKVPFWWRWYAHFKLTGLERCYRLDAMGPLDTTDIDDWLARFPHLLRAHYDRNQLRDDLFDLFESGCTVRYQQVRRCLIDGRGCLRNGNGVINHYGLKVHSLED